MGCTGSKEDVAATNQPAHMEVTSVDQQKLAEKSKQLEEREEGRLQKSATDKAAGAEKQANEAAAEGIALKLSASMAEKEIEKSQVAAQELKIEQRKGAVESFKGMGAKLRFREAMQAGKVADALDPAALMVQATWRAYCSRRKAVAKRAEKQALLEHGLARKLQSLYRCRLARRRAEAKREEKRQIVRTEAERRANKSAKLEDVDVKLSPPELMKGIIQKEGQVVKSVKPRYFVLRIDGADAKLTYYAKDSPKEPWGVDEKGFIFLKGSILVDKPGVGYMVTDREGRDLKLTFMSVPDKQKWKKAFEEHVAYVNKK